MTSLRPIFFASFFFSFHAALLSYLNSTVLGEFGGSFGTTFAYISGSILSLILIIEGPRLARRFGASYFLIGSLGASMVLLWLLSGTTTPNVFIGLFILYFSLNTVIWYAFDLVIEHYSRENVTGNIRGTYLTLNNIAWVVAPIISSIIATRLGFSGAYVIASIFLMCSFLIISRTKKILSDKHLPKTSLSEAFKALIQKPKARRIVSLYFVLQFFFAWMVLYMTPYLRDLGFSWSVIGIIFSTMLLPFVLFQYPAGKISDKFHAEKTLILVGFCIMAISTLFLGFPLPAKAVIFAAILFFTRVGASIVEVACESAFFKEVSERDTALISTLRMTLPLAYIIAPLLGTIILSFGSIQTLFIVLCFILLAAALYSFRLNR